MNARGLGSILALCVLPCGPSTAGATEPADEVNPMVGTGGLGWGVGSIVPGATLPFGMVKLSPDTSTGEVAPSFSHCGGYWYPDSEIRGFSHTHLVGTGASDQGNLLVMPLIGIDDTQTVESGYRSPFSHETEVASPGYYALTVQNGNIRVELTATERGGLHRYTFPATNQATILVDLTAMIEDGSVTDAWFELNPDTGELIGGLVSFGSFSRRYGGQPLYFSMLFRSPIERYGAFADGVSYPDRTAIDGTTLGSWVQYTVGSDEPLEVEVGISYVSVDNAQLNRAVEVSGRTFDEIRLDAEALWNEELSGIEIEGGTSTQRRIFYSSLYHSKMMPTLYTDVNGQYMGFDKQPHLASNFTYYTDFSMWDTFRTFHPLTHLIDAQRSADFANSLLAMFDQSGYIDRWPQGNGPTGSMVGDAPASVLSEAMLKGLEGFDTRRAYEILDAYATPGGASHTRDHLDTYASLGFVPVEQGGRSTSVTLEYAYNDAALAYMARALGDLEDAHGYAQRSLSYRRHFNPETGYLQGLHEDGTFVTPFIPKYHAEYFAEGNALQWSWYAPHDVAGLIDLFGGAPVFQLRLERFFEDSAATKDTLFPDMNYWHGNEPDIHASYLFHYIGRPDLSAKWVRWIMEAKYRDAPDGLDGNDDGGTLSAWYVLSALGLFPIAGTDVYLIGSPLFTQARVRASHGVLTLLATDATETNLYVQSARLNGQPLERSWLRHAELRNAVLELQMGPEPSSWAHQGELPPSISRELLGERARERIESDRLPQKKRQRR